MLRKATYIVTFVVTIMCFAALLATKPFTQTPLAYGAPLTSNAVDIEGRHIVENDLTLQTGRHTFVLTASDSAPMPEGSTGNVKKVTINSNEVFRFGAITFDAPGSYQYLVSREIIEAKDLIQDNSVYLCHVEVYPDGTAVVIFEKLGTEGKPNKIEYRDTYLGPHDDDPPNPPNPPSPPNPSNGDSGGTPAKQLAKTGDSLAQSGLFTTLAATAATAAAVATAALVLAGIARRKQTYQLTRGKAD